MATPTASKTVGARMVEMKGKLVDALKDLNVIWEDMGLLEDQKEERFNLVFVHLSNLIEEMVMEEEKRRKTLKDSIEVYKEMLCTLCAELNIPPIQQTATRLCELEEELIQNVNCWQSEKNRRLEELCELRKIEQALCDTMQTTPLYIPKNTVPSSEQLAELRDITNRLANEKAKRFHTFTEKKSLITNIMADIGEEVTTEFEQDVVIENPECFVLSDNAMARLNELADELEVKLEARKEVMEKLKGKILALWNRLEVDEEERREVLSKVIDHTPASLTLLEEELTRCERLKFEHLQEFTVKVRQELVVWWDKCHYSRAQRANFTPFHSEEYSEELLLQHEDALEAVKYFYSDNEHLLKKIEKRTELWNQMVAFDEKENDPNRFRNRGGNLLAEEREKKKVLHQLPKVEEQLKAEIGEWEQENDRKFLIGGVPFMEFCRLQWDEYKQSKELQKQQRIEQKEKEKKTELMYGSKPTPAKRRFCAQGTTPGTSSKQRKLDDTTSRSSTRLQTLSRINSVFASPSTPASCSRRTPLRQSKTTSSLLCVTPSPARKPPVSRTPMSTMGPPRTPVSTMGPPRTPMSTRSTARTPMSTRSTTRKTEMKKAKSCISLASPKLKTPAKELKSATKNKNEKENVLQVTSRSVEDIVNFSSGSSEVEPAASSYEEFEHALHSAKKTTQYRSTICPPK